MNNDEKIKLICEAGELSRAYQRRLISQLGMKELFNDTTKGDEQMVFQCDIPKYTQGPITGKDIPIPCVRSGDIEDEERRNRLEEFMRGQTRIMVDEEIIPFEEQDFIYLCDYINFCHKEKTGKALFWD